VLAVDGAGAGWSRVGEDDGQRIEVKVNHRIEDRYDFRLTYEMPVDEEAESVSIPELRAEDVVRQTGFIGIAVRGAVEVNPGGLEERLTRIDVSELPADVRAQSANPILLAYKYAEAGYELALDMRRLEDIEVRIAGIDHARLTTMITEEGTAVTRAEYRVRNNLKQFLRIELGPEVEIWGAEVGGQVVKPARETDSDTVLIPLSKSSVANRRMASFPVALVYMQRLERPMGWLRRVDLKTPSTDILANELEWRVMVPKEQFVYRATGDLDEERGRRRGEAALSREALGFEMETIRPLQEGVERFMITDINNAAASAGGGEKRYTEGPASGTARRPGDTVVAGVLPVSVRFPTEGTAHLYRRLLVSEGETSELRLYTCTKGLRTAARVLLFVLALGAGAALFRGLVRRQMTGRGDAARWVLLGLVLGLASLGAAAAWAGHSATALACVGMLVGLVAEGVRQWVTSSPRRDSDEIASGGEPGAAGDDGGVGE